jgi:hypothetical protein
MRKYVWVVIAVVPLMLGLTACGASSSGTGVASAQTGTSKSTPSATKTLSPEESMLKFTQCMRAHGVKVADPKPGKPFKFTSKSGPGTKSNPMDTATKACQQYLQTGNVKGPADDPKMLDAMVKFAQCMRAHGVNVPDPKPNGGPSLIKPQGSKAKVDAAQKACQSLLPGEQSGGPGLHISSGGSGQSNSQSGAGQ